MSTVAACVDLFATGHGFLAQAGEGAWMLTFTVDFPFDFGIGDTWHGALPHLDGAWMFTLSVELPF